LLFNKIIKDTMNLGNYEITSNVLLTQHLGEIEVHLMVKRNQLDSTELLVLVFRWNCNKLGDIGEKW